MRSIPSRDQLYFDGKHFRVKSPFFKVFKIGLAAGLALGFLLFSSVNEAAYDNAIVHMQSVVKPPNKKLALINYVSGFNQDDAKEIVDSAYKWAKHFDIDPIMVLAIANTESHFDKTAISNAGAMGLMQILTKWHIDKIVEAKKTLGDPSPFNIDTNIFLGSWVFKDCQQSNKSLESQLHCYNGATSKESTYDDKVMIAFNKLKKV